MQIIELHYQNRDVALHAKLALHNGLVLGKEIVFVFIPLDYSEACASGKKTHLFSPKTLQV